MNGAFGFLHQLQSFTPEEIVKRSSNLIKPYPEDLEERLGEEFVQFTELLKTDLASHIDAKAKQDLVELQLYRLITDNSLESFSKCRKCLAHLFVTHDYQLQRRTIIFKTEKN